MVGEVKTGGPRPTNEAQPASAAARTPAEIIAAARKPPTDAELSAAREVLAAERDRRGIPA